MKLAFGSFILNRFHHAASSEPSLLADKMKTFKNDSNQIFDLFCRLLTYMYFEMSIFKMSSSNIIIVSIKNLLCSKLKDVCAFHIVKQLRHRRTCTNAHTRQSDLCSKYG